MFIRLLYKRGLGYLILSYQQALLVTQTDKLIKLPQDRVPFWLFCDGGGDVSDYVTRNTDCVDNF